MSSQHSPSHEYEREMVRAMMNRPFSNAGLKQGTSSNSDIRVDNSVTYLVDGEFKSLSAKEVSPGGSDLGNDEKCVYLVSVDDSQNLTATQSAVVGSGENDPDIPQVPSGETPLGTVKVETNSSTTYTPGTDSLGKSGVTVTYTDMAWPNTGKDSIAY